MTVFFLLSGCETECVWVPVTQAHKTQLEHVASMYREARYHAHTLIGSTIAEILSGARTDHFKAGTAQPQRSWRACGVESVTSNPCLTELEIFGLYIAG